VSVTSLLCGAATNNSATVVAEVGAGVSCRLAVSTASDLSSPAYTSAVAADSNGYARLPVTGLATSTQYYYGVETAGVLDPARGQFRTHPTPGQPASFTIAHASCMQGPGGGVPSDHRVFDSIRARDPLMFMHLGDLHYDNINSASVSAYQAGIRDAITAPRPAAMFASMAMSYVWDDHDFGPDNSDKNAPGRTQAAQVYRQAIPYYPLNDSGGIWQAWTIGRVRFIQTDLRYYRSPDTDTDNDSKTMLGDLQKAWFKAELLAAKDGPLTCWLNSQVWQVDTFAGIDSDGDHWGAFSTERAEIDQFRADNGITNVIDLTGDMHALGIGLADFSTPPRAPKRIYAGSSLDSIPVLRGGSGAWLTSATGRGQYGTLTVADDGVDFGYTWQGWRTDPETGAETLVMSDTVSGSDADPTLSNRAVKVWNGTRWVARPVCTRSAGAWGRRSVSAS
jgi:phosphodiesterase/alkaline phosphatase D-like protein